MEKLITLLLILGIITTTTGSLLGKCCDPDEQFNRTTGDGFECVPIQTNRLTFLGNNYYPLGNATLCVEVFENNFELFEVTDDNSVVMVQRQEEFLKHFKKCCPFGTVYDLPTHSCKETLEPTKNLSDHHLLKIGLPHCQVIVDQNFDSFKQLSEEIEKIEEEDYCFDHTTNQTYVLRTCSSLDICKSIKCVKKCCPDGQSFINRSHCYDTYSHGVDLTSSQRIKGQDDPFALVHKYSCSKIYPLQENRSNFILAENGSLAIIKNYNQINITKYYDHTMKTSYCIEHATSSRINGYAFFMCFEEIEIKPKYSYTLPAKILSCICLSITLIVYGLLPKRRNLFGKTLMPYCATSLACYILLIYLHINRNIRDLECSIFAYALVFLIECQFSWLNTICWDIWNTFGNPKTVLTLSKQDRRKYFYYNLYAWGLPAFFTVLILIFNITKVLPDSIHPFLGKTKCFLETPKDFTNYGVIIFKDIPLLILELINVTLFFKTVIYCIKVKNEINRINQTSVVGKEKKKAVSTDTEKLLLVAKLFVVMGSNFLFEVVSSFFKMSQNPVTEYIEIVWDNITCLTGVFVFIIFVAKKDILKDVLERCGLSGKLSSEGTTVMTMNDCSSK